MKSFRRLVSGLLFCSLSIYLYAQVNYKTEFVVALDGSGDFTSIQATLDACKSFPDVPIRILVKEGVYKEKITVHSWNTRISIIGEGDVVLSYDDYFKKIERGRNSTFMTYTLRVMANDFRAENITIENTAGRVGQAVALHVEADRAAFVNCRILGNQDTVYLAGEGSRQYFENCYIEGTVDFIFGEATAYFENCELRSKSDSYLTAASTHPNVPYGFVFSNCKLTADEGVANAWLGRPWRNGARTIFVDCEIGGHINPEGWSNWGRKEAEETVFYAELNCTGPGSATEGRLAWTHQLEASERSTYAKEKVLRNWKP